MWLLGFRILGARSGDHFCVVKGDTPATCLSHWEVTSSRKGWGQMESRWRCHPKTCTEETCMGGKKKIPGNYVGKDGLERIWGEPGGQEPQTAHTEKSLRNSEVRKEVDSFKRWKHQDQLQNYCCRMRLWKTWAGCKLLTARGSSTLKNPF